MNGNSGTTPGECDKMRTALFSDKEREMVNQFLKTGEKGEGFRVLAFRVRQSQIMIMEDFDLMIKVLTKLENFAVCDERR